MKILPVVYLTYMFISLYFLSVYLLLYLKNKKRIFDYPKTSKKYSVSVVIPAYNEEKTIQGTIEAIMGSDYKEIVEVIVMNDGSKDKTAEIVKMLMKRHKKLKLVNKENSGKAESLNRALKLSEGELFAVVDADSYPSKDAFSKMSGFFDDAKVGAATTVFVPRNREKFIEKLQAIEYRVIAFTRKLLDYVDAVYVTPGPLALYRKKALLDIGGFDAKNMTEDIEATWHLVSEGWDRKMCLATSATTVVPDKFRKWFVQRKRWNVGGLQCINKYKKALLKKGMLGFFIIPFFIMSTFLGLLGLSIFSYLWGKRILQNYIFASYSLEAGTSLITMESFYITPSVLNYLGAVLFVMGAIFVLVVLSLMKQKILKKQNVFNILFYMVVYIAVYPLIMVSAIYDMVAGRRKWR